jgi:hypothetical protein
LFHCWVFVYKVLMETAHFPCTSIGKHGSILYHMAYLWAVDIFIQLSCFAEMKTNDT